MRGKIIKIVTAVGGLVLAWVLIFFVFGEPRNPQPVAQLEFWNVFDTTDDMKPLLSEFSEETGIEVNYRSFTDLQEYRETLLFELAAGEGPDVLAVHGSWIPKYKNLLHPLPVELRYSTENVHHDFVDAVASTVILEDEETSEVKIFALPMYLDTLAIYFNKTLFRNVLSKPYPAPELTWSGVREDVIALTAKDSDDPEDFLLAGIALGRADNITRGVELFYTLYRQLGGKNLTEASGERARDDSGKSYQPLAATVDFLTSFSRDYRNQEYSWNSKISAEASEKELDAFVRGKVAMIAGYSYYFEEIKDLIWQQKKLGKKSIEISEVGIAPFPQIHDPQVGNPKVVLADFFALAVAKSSENPLESWQLILELTGNSAQEEYFEITKKPTSRRDLIEEQKEDSLWGIFAEQAVYADTLAIADDKLFAEAVADVLNRVSDGEITSNEGSKELEKVFASADEKKE